MAVAISRGLPSAGVCGGRFCLSKQDKLSCAQTVAKESSFVIDAAIYFLCCRANSLCDNYGYIFGGASLGAARCRGVGQCAGKAVGKATMLKICAESRAVVWAAASVAAGALAAVLAGRASESSAAAAFPAFSFWW